MRSANPLEGTKGVKSPHGSPAPSFPRGAQNMTDRFVTRTLVVLNVLAVPIVGAIFASITLGTGTLQSLLVL